MQSQLTHLMQAIVEPEEAAAEEPPPAPTEEDAEAAAAAEPAGAATPPGESEDVAPPPVPSDVGPSGVPPVYDEVPMVSGSWTRGTFRERIECVDTARRVDQIRGSPHVRYHSRSFAERHWHGGGHVWLTTTFIHEHKKKSIDGLD